MAGTRGGDPRFKMTRLVELSVLTHRDMPLGGSAGLSPATSGEYPAKPGEGGRNTFDPPLWAMFEPRQFWEGHWVMNEEPCWHLENPCHSHQIGQSHSFKLAVLPIRWVDTTAAPVRTVVLLER